MQEGGGHECHAVLRVASTVQEPDGRHGVGAIGEFVQTVDCEEETGDIETAPGHWGNVFEGCVGLWDGRAEGREG